jgi:hypothetical protein
VHPSPPTPLGVILAAEDRRTASRVPHRVLVERTGVRATTVERFRAMLVQHHTSEEALRRTRERLEALARQGIDSAYFPRRFPTNVVTQKSNLAEIVLAEYVVAANSLSLPVYRLRYNPNVDQSMKGDDVLAFDLDAQPPRIVVGEAKFRATSSDAVVGEIVDGLMRSYKNGIPVSLTFVADRLYESGQVELADRVQDCARLFALRRLRIDYVGLLLSDANAAVRVDGATPTPSPVRRLAMISLSVPDPDPLVAACYVGLNT